MEDKKIKIVETGDGSSTLYNEELNETYHSSHGALTESRHVFIKAGFAPVSEKTKEVAILEIGFGTGLNAILTIEEALKNPDIQIVYTTLEPFPLDNDLVEGLNYKQLIDESLHPYFDQLHQATWNEDVQILPNFILHKADKKLEEFDAKNRRFNLVYYDAFAPSKQPDMWTEDNLAKCFALSQEECMLVTYCASGQFKRNLKSAGFAIESYPGPPGKREMTRGLK
ncbi:tRNA (5-methylaminomethyl-2-thiouridine)(34)-methyltransferase MnmD [Limibacter armeniacum]|uniref:tRNA (5-methylaminomethyl-2-thiouridine)(34)-methyltransferase MnmD n=1 Tax=Limibacter armeniacum TaxID=466084 RepID=UPI002FE65659